MLITDLSRMYRLIKNGSRSHKIINCYRTPGFQSVLVYRFGHWLLTRPHPLVRAFLKPLYMLLAYRCRRVWGIEIDPEAVIGPGLVIFHFGGILIGPAVIGRNASIAHQVTIGHAGTGAHRGVPTIGNNVRISPGAKIAGSIKIGNNVRIGANAVVQRDIPDDALVQIRPMQVATFPSLYNRSVEEEGGETVT